MRRIVFFGPVGLLFSIGVLLTPMAFGQVCQATNASLNGAYGFVAMQTGTSNTSTGTGSGSGSSNTTAFSSTSVGQLIGGVSGTSPFSTVGRFFFDGAGNIYATASAGGTLVMVGTYNINSDCTVTVSLTDAFETSTSTTTGTSSAAKASLYGIVVNGGNELDLTASNSSSTTTANTRTNTGVIVTLYKLLLTTGCSAVNLTGAYGLVGTGLQAVAAQPPGTANSSGTVVTGVTPPGTTIQSSTFLARVQFDGAGNVTPDLFASSAPSGINLYTGTYTVNTDCTGSMTLTPGSSSSSSGSSSGSSTAASTTVSFLLASPSPASNTSTPRLSTYQNHPGLIFSISNSSQTIFGYGTAQ